MPEKQTLEIGKGKPGPGRPKGVPNKVTMDLRRAILDAAEAAGGAQGAVGYLTKQATANPAAFMALLGRVLPTMHAGDPDNPVSVVTRIVLVAGQK